MAHPSQTPAQSLHPVRVNIFLKPHGATCWVPSDVSPVSLELSPASACLRSLSPRDAGPWNDYLGSNSWSQQKSTVGTYSLFIFFILPSLLFLLHLSVYNPIIILNIPWIISIDYKFKCHCILLIKFTTGGFFYFFFVLFSRAF